jgi:hypothetical protein
LLCELSLLVSMMSARATQFYRAFAAAFRNCC